MDTSKLVDRAGLKVRCPHCGLVDCDEYEVLDANRATSMRCSLCGFAFAILIAECPHCESETAFSWARAPTDDMLGSLQCRACNRWLGRDETETDHLGRAA